MSEESAERMVEEKLEEKVEKAEKAEKAEKREKGVFRHYKVEGEKLKKLLPFCERCGPGYFMADHGDRYACGHCGFTRYKVAETRG
jgi:small subunit ribosomal protein S27Ae